MNYIYNDFCTNYKKKSTSTVGRIPERILIEARAPKFVNFPRKTIGEISVG